MPCAPTPLIFVTICNKNYHTLLPLRHYIIIEWPQKPLLRNWLHFHKNIFCSYWYQFLEILVICFLVFRKFKALYIEKSNNKLLSYFFADYDFIRLDKFIWPDWTLWLLDLHTLHFQFLREIIFNFIYSKYSQLLFLWSSPSGIIWRLFSCSV